jgi:hypothetical protein
MCTRSMRSSRRRRSCERYEYYRGYVLFNLQSEL